MCCIYTRAKIINGSRVERRGSGGGGGGGGDEEIAA
jgi:hypothetical protein